MPPFPPKRPLSLNSRTALAINDAAARHVGNVDVALMASFAAHSRNRSSLSCINLTNLQNERIYLQQMLAELLEQGINLSGPWKLGISDILMEEILIEEEEQSQSLEQKLTSL